MRLGARRVRDLGVRHECSLEYGAGTDRSGAQAHVRLEARRKSGLGLGVGAIRNKARALTKCFLRSLKTHKRWSKKFYNSELTITKI